MLYNYYLIIAQATFCMKLGGSIDLKCESVTYVQTYYMIPRVHILQGGRVSYFSIACINWSYDAMLKLTSIMIVGQAFAKQIGQR